MEYFPSNLIHLRRKKGLKSQEIAFELKLKPTAYSNYEKGHSVPTLATLLQISNYFGVQIDALLHSDLSKDNGNSYVSEAQPEYGKAKPIPLITVEAMAGVRSGDFTVLDAQKYVVPEFNGVDFLIRVKGNSMYPKYSSGDIVACKYVQESKFIQWGKTYVMDTTQGAIVKRLYKSEAENAVVCKSDNPAYPEFDLPKDEIRSLAIVVGVIRLE